MTKSEKRKLRKAARVLGKPLTDELALTPISDREEFSETPAGYRARERWAQRYEALNGAPEGDWDR